ncbi:hypothetical protein WR25_26587 [Diploscapter pachys]|uniref:Uncharacterized protein n=1 Tax=Diploscapter pachys TaxID=2018661 RepID=A0A2A2KH57_9BILA|nr:hypothetical protein WR25_26587 [Diploscapter pachys]
MLLGNPANTNGKVQIVGAQIQGMVAEVCLDLALRISLRECGNGRHHDTDAVIERGGQALLEDQCTAVIELLTRLGGADFPRAANQQCGATVAFQSRHLLADHGLGDAEALGSGGEGAGFDHRGEVRKPVQAGSAGH